MRPEAGRVQGKLLVTGVTGAIGNRIAHLLVEEGRDVVGLVRPGSDRSPLDNIDIELVDGDVTDQASLERAMNECGSVIHSAGLVPGTGTTEEAFREVNSDGTRNVIAAAISSGVERLVHISTVNAMPILPGVTVTEDAPPPEFPHPGYDVSKVEAERAVLEASKGQLYAVVVNPAVVFGPGTRSSARIIRAFVRGRLPFVPLPNRRMSMVYVDDVAHGCILALDKGTRGERYILSNPAITISEFIDELAAVTGRRRPRLTLPAWLAAFAVGALWSIRPVTRWRPPVTVSGVRRGGTLYDGSRAERELGLGYTDLSDALRATVEWILAEPR